ncbi:MAG: type II secretion system F family protein [Bryobacteraceae bacterium]|jgi:tight adherence protein C
MLDALTAGVFLLVACVTAAAGFSLSSARTRALQRLSPEPKLVKLFLPSPALIWRDLVDRLGSAVPASPKDLPALKRRLIRAGWRNRDAARVFQGARAVAITILGPAAAAFSLHSGASTGDLLIAVGAASVAGYMAPSLFLDFRTRRRQRAIEKGLPNALDLMVVCVESGLGIDQTMVQVAKEFETAYPEISDEFAIMNLEMRAGKRRAEALRNLADRTGVDDLRKLTAVLVQTDRFGTSIAQCLRGHSDYLRVLARQRAEERAAKVAIKLVFPIFFCVLPSLFVVTVGPVLTRLGRELIPFIENM